MKKKENFINIDDIYKQMIDDSSLSLQRYKEICFLFIKFMIGKIFEGYCILLPFRLGSFYVSGTKTIPKFKEQGITGVAPNWKATKELWENDEEAKANKQIVYFLNEHTFGNKYKFNHSLKNSIVKNINTYRFRLTRHNKRELSRIIKTGKEFLIKQ